MGWNIGASQSNGWDIGASQLQPGTPPPVTGIAILRRRMEDSSMKIYLAPYGVALTVPMNLVAPDGVDFITDAVHASGDTFLTKDEGAEANSTNGFVDEGSGYSLVLTATEMEAARVHLFFIDQTGTKVWLDTDVVIMTYGNASAQYPTIGTQTGDSYARIGVAGAGLTNINLPDQTMDITGDLSGSVGSVTAQVTADVTAISGDSTAANNLESQYDETGLVGDTFPANQAQLGNIANTGAAINKVAEDATLTTGTQVNTYVATQALDGVYHEITPAGGVTDVQYEFNIGGTGIPVSVTFSGRLFDPPVTSDVMSIQAWDWVGSAWSQVGTLDGVNSAVDSVKTVILFTNMVGTGANSGEVLLRFYDAVIAADSVLFIDLLYVSYSVVSSAVGYANGSIWIDTVDGTAGTVDNVNGTADNPALTIADALTLSASLGLKRFTVAPNSTITFAADMTGLAFTGEKWILNTGGQNMTNVYIWGAIVNGVITGTSNPVFDHCNLVNVTTIPFTAFDTNFGGTITVTAAGDFFVVNCSSGVAGSGTPVWDFDSVASVNINHRDYSGGWEFRNMVVGGTDIISLEGDGQYILNANCLGGELHVRGSFEKTDNTAGAVTIFETANIKTDTIHDGYARASTVNTIQLSTSASSTNGAYDPAMILIVAGTGEGQTRLIYGYVGATRIAVVDRDWKVAPDTTSEYRVIANPGREHVNEGQAQAGGAATITLNALASALDDAYNGQVVFLRSGIGEDQARRVTDYDGTTKVATVDSNWGTQPDVTTGYVMLPTATVDIASLAKEATLDLMSGATFDTSTDSLEAIRNRGDAAWLTATGFPTDKDGYTLSAAGIDAILDEQIGDGTLTMRETLRVCISILAGETSGGGTATLTFRNDADSANVLVETVDANGNRTSTTLTP